MEQVNKDKVLAMLVKTFFRYFTLGIVETQSADNDMEKFEPQNIKRTMLNHYESISQCFNSEMFYAISRMNYKAEEIEQEIRSFVKKDTTQMDLVRLACRTEAFHAAMVSEYRRNFELLMCGRLATQNEHEAAYTRCQILGTIDMQDAIDIISKMTESAYTAGRSIGEAATKK